MKGKCYVFISGIRNDGSLRLMMFLLMCVHYGSFNSRDFNLGLRSKDDSYPVGGQSVCSSSVVTKVTVLV